MLAEGEFPYDFFVSRRGTAADVAVEVSDVLESAGYKVLVQDFDIPFSSNFVSAMHDALKAARHFVGLLTEDYDVSPFTRAEWTSFFALAAATGGRRRLAILRVENVAPPGLLAPIVYGDLINVTDSEKRREIILATAEGRSIGKRRGEQIFHGVPPQNPDFTGRVDLLEAIHRSLSTLGQQATVTQAAHLAVYGLGGVGKTSLAAEYAYRHTDEYAGIWWAPAEDRTVLIASLAELGRALDERLINEAIAERAARHALETLTKQNRPWLLIYDNVKGPEEIEGFRPTKGARLLITTRHPDWGGQADELEVDVLDPDAAINFLAKRTGREDREGAARLAEELGYLPLALDHAGAYVVRAGITLQDYTTRYYDLIANAPKGATSVTGTFGLAIEMAKAECEAADKLLAFFSVLAPEKIPLDLVGNSIVHDRERDAAMISLSSVSLIKSAPLPNGTMAMSVHRLVRAAVRTRLVSTKKLVSTLTSATARVLATFPDEEMVDDPKSWPRCEQLLPHALCLARDPANHSKFTVFLGLRAGHFLTERGAYAQAEQLLRESLSIAARLFGPKHPQFSLAMRQTASVIARLDKISEAEALSRQALKIYTKKRAEEDELLAAFLTTLGDVVAMAGRPHEAEPLYARAISILRKKVGPKNRKLAKPLANFATTLGDLGRYPDAEKCLLDAISIEERIFGRDSYSVAISLTNLATIFRRMGRFVEAEKTANEAIAALEKFCGRKHPGFAAAIGSLALTFLDTGRHLDAEPLIREAIEILVETVGPEHPHVGHGRAASAILLAETGRINEANEELSHALAIHRQSLASGLLWTRSSARELVNALIILGRTSEAVDTRTRYGFE